MKGETFHIFNKGVMNMVSRKNLKVSIVLLVGICCTLVSPSLSNAQTDVTLSVSEGSGVRGSSCCNPNYPDANRVEVVLDNPSDRVGILQVDICSTDLGGHLLFSGYEISPRAQALNHSISFDAVSHCVEVRFFWTQPYGSVYIPEGSGSIATLNFDVSQFAPSGNCPAGGDLTMSAVQVRDALSGGLTVTEDPGKFCYYRCSSDLHCDDGIFCNGEEVCFGNVWCMENPIGDPCLPLLCNEAADRCSCDADWQCEDELFCNGVETCNVGTGNCQRTPSCSDDGDPCTDDCDEGSDTCVEVCNADGPWDACCGSSSLCGGIPVCNEEVTLTIGAGSGLPSSTGNDVVVSLDNPTDQVSFVSAHICDGDDYLTLSSSPDCVVSGRAAGYECNCEEETIGTAAGCVGCGVFDPTGTLPPISAGSGPLFTLNFDVSSGAGVCTDHYFWTEEPFPVVVKDNNNQPLVTMPVDGEFCILCTSSADCADGNDCTNDSCVGGSCQYTNLTVNCNDGDPCTSADKCRKADFGTKNVCVGIDDDPDDGSYCNGVESCDGLAPNPCASCDEGNDVCVGSDVNLIIENVAGREGVITIALENSFDEVGEVHVDVCDADQRGWLHISAENCSTAIRTSGFNCITTDLGNGCVGVDIISNFPLDFIATGTGAIAYLNYTVDTVTIPPENYADLDPQAPDVKDRDAVTLLVTPKPGKLTIVEACEGDFDSNGNVDANDVSGFLADFGRSLYNRPCPNDPKCIADFDCDTDVDSNDLNVFLEDFGRSQFFNPCPLLPPLVCGY
jgi:hypothetical protein